MPTSDDAERLVWEAMQTRRASGEVLSLGLLADTLDQANAGVTPEALAKFTQWLGRGRADETAPVPLIRFMGAFATRRAVRRVLDPMGGFGQLAAEISRRLPEARVVGLLHRTESLRLAQRLLGTVAWRVCNALHDPEAFTEPNDLVVCCPPFNVAAREATEQDPQARQQLAERLLVASAGSISPDGEALFVLSPSCWANNAEWGWRTQLARAGFAIGACIWVPPGTFAPSTSIPAVLVQVRRGPQEDLFVAELPASDDQAREVLGNVLKHRSGRDARLGRWVSLAGFSSLPRLLADERLAQLGRRAGTARRIGDVASVVKWKPGDDGAPHKILMPAEGSSRRPAILASQVDDVKGRFLALDVNEAFAVPEYVAHYLGGELGQLARDAAAEGAAVRRVSPEAFADGTMYLPSVEVQRSVVALSGRIQGLMNELRELEERAWSAPSSHDAVRASLAKVNHEDRFELWLDTLPYPLATILWLYRTQPRAKDKVETLFHFFEAYAQFWAIVLLSWFMRESSGRETCAATVQQLLLKQKQTLDYASFGTWLSLAEFFAKQARQSRDGGEDDLSWLRRQAAATDERVFDLLLSKEIAQVLRVTNSLRNRWKGHGGAVSDDVASARLESLEKHLGDLRAVTGERWQLYSLYRVGLLEYRDGFFDATVERVMGTRAPFLGGRIGLTAPAENGSLCLAGEGARDAVPLLPFVKFMSSPKTALNACYFYNHRTKDGVCFVSYHFAEDAERTDAFADTASHVESLSPPKDAR